MKTEKQIEINISKSKLLFLFIGSLLFISIGILFVKNPSRFESLIFNNPALISYAGFAAISFFGLTGIFILRKLFDTKPGIIINEEGILDNASAVSAGQISWGDVSGIRITKVVTQNFLIILVHNPEEYISRQTNAVKRKLMETNFKIYGTPINISANGLQCSFDELQNILIKKFDEFKSKKTIG